MNTTVEESHFERIREVLTATGLAATAITPDAHLTRDLGLDSLDIVELTMNLEKEFGLVITDAEMSTIRTVGQVLELVQRQTAAHV